MIQTLDHLHRYVPVVTSRATSMQAGTSTTAATERVSALKFHRLLMGKQIFIDHNHD